MYGKRGIKSRYRRLDNVFGHRSRYDGIECPPQKRHFHVEIVAILEAEQLSVGAPQTLPGIHCPDVFRILRISCGVQPLWS